MKIYDISVPLRKETPVYEGDPAIEIIPHKSITEGDVANITLLKMGAHSGTHIDAPYHFNQKGIHIDELDLDTLIGPAQVIEAEAKEGLVTRDELMYSIDQDIKRILIKTANSALWEKSEFFSGFVSLSLEAATWAVKKGIKLIGIDYLSIEKFHSSDHAVHRTLLENSVVVVEGLNLSEVGPGKYNLTCLPLRIKGGDGSPARAILMTID